MSGSLVFDIRHSYGAAFVALLFNHMLFGLEIVQAWTYYWQYWNKDKKTFKFFIAFLLVIDAMSMLMCDFSIYWYLVLNFGNVESLDSRVWYMSLQLLLGYIPICAVELYYVRQAYRMSQSVICPVIVVPLIFGGTFFGFFSTVKELTRSADADATWLPCVWMGANILGDIVITVTMCWSLYRKRTGFARTDSIILTLIINTIKSGFLLSALGTAMTISYAIAPSNLIWLAFYWVQSKCFVNSLLAMLNIRDYILDRSARSATDIAYGLTSIRFRPPSDACGFKSRQLGVTVTVHRSTTSYFAQREYDHTTGATVEDPKPL